MKQKIILWLTTLLVIGTVSALVVHKEKILNQGTLVLLQLAPVDPRSILQGDYMILRYKLANDVRTAIIKSTRQPTSFNGKVVIALSADHIASLVRIHDDKTPLASNQHLLKFRNRGQQVRFAAEAWFFQEGHAADFNKARFGELKVSKSGEAVLTGLRDKDLKPLRHVFKTTASAIP